MVSVAGIRPDSRKSVRVFKGIFCADISEFESYHPSHAVVSSEPLECAENSIRPDAGQLLLTQTVRFWIRVIRSDRPLLVALVPFALVIRYGVVAREEAYLERQPEAVESAMAPIRL